VRPAKECKANHEIQKKNPLKSDTQLFKLNPNAKIQKETAKKANDDARKRRQEALKAKRGFSAGKSKEEKVEFKKLKDGSKSWIKNFKKNMKEGTDKAQEQEAAWKKEGQEYQPGEEEELVM